MNESVGRLMRLHILRCRIADAVTAERKRAAEDVRSTEQAAAALREVTAAAMQRGNDMEQPWSERKAQMQLATELRERLVMRCEDLRQAETKAVAAERAAIMDREQIGCVLERAEAELTRAQTRQEQVRLDDLFATAAVRRRMATSF